MLNTIASVKRVMSLIPVSAALIRSFITRVGQEHSDEVFHIPITVPIFGANIVMPNSCDQRIGVSNFNIVWIEAVAGIAD
ncbi:hypothetical protein SDC9_93732 [bioreactor metagenome]|uniref:Uncharacterized protein n=1 Tax=bioreactor metagenome TaxID=1076179 RepID=A0A645ABG0_9ZZZZ